MPSLSASEYTTFLKFKAAGASPIRPAIQTRDNVSVSQSVISANVLASQAAFVVAPPSNIVVTSPATVTGALTSVINAATFAGSSGVEYTTVQPHGLVAGQTITVTGLTQNTLNVDPNVTGAVIVTGVSTFVIVISGVTSGSASGTGRIVGRVYYTSGSAHGLVPGDVATVTGVGLFSVSGATVLAVPSFTTFVLSNTTFTTAVSGASGVLTYPRSSNQSTAVRGISRVMPYLPGTTNNPKALSTIAHSTGSVLSQPGGLPAKNRVVYTRLPQIV